MHSLILAQNKSVWWLVDVLCNKESQESNGEFPEGKNGFSTALGWSEGRDVGRYQHLEPVFCMEGHPV